MPYKQPSVHKKYRVLVLGTLLLWMLSFLGPLSYVLDTLPLVSVHLFSQHFLEKQMEDMHFLPQVICNRKW